jgi:hypothetical protein
MLTVLPIELAEPRILVVKVQFVEAWTAGTDAAPTRHNSASSKKIRLAMTILRFFKL